MQKMIKADKVMKLIKAVLSLPYNVFLMLITLIVYAIIEIILSISLWWKRRKQK